MFQTMHQVDPCTDYMYVWIEKYETKTKYKYDSDPWNSYQALLPSL